MSVTVAAAQRTQRVIRVPQDRKTIQAAVNAATPGTLVLVDGLQRGVAPLTLAT